MKKVFKSFDVNVLSQVTVVTQEGLEEQCLHALKAF